MKKQTIIKLLVAFMIAAVIFPAVSKNANAATTWTVWYHTNGGEDIPYETVEDGKYAKQPTPRKEGYVFKGWYTDPELKNYYGGFAVHEDLHLYASWYELVRVVSATTKVPVAGEVVDHSITFSEGSRCTNPRPDCFDICEINERGYSQGYLDDGDVYEAGKIYRFFVCFTPDRGYDYSRAETQAYINGVEAKWWTSIGDGWHTCIWYIDYALPEAAPEITKQPASKRVQVGDVAQFTVAAKGTGTLKYQWQSRKDSSSEWSNSGQPGAKTSTLKVTTTPGLHGWQFRCLVTDNNGTTPSEPATLKVAPKITTQPKNASVQVGNVAKFTIVAAGKAPLKYQWQSRKNSSAEWTNSGQPGAKTATLEVTATAGLHGWQFRCVVTDANGQAWGSAAATLSVSPKFTTQPKNTSVQVGNVAKFTVVAIGKAPLKYQWQSRKNSSAEWTNSGQPGAKTATLQVTATAGLNGWQFRCVVTDANGKSWGSAPATLTVK
ncbi:MAG: InlB B-repeat-containing protein [Lachnospiraceae bacterium]|nr:InlB B-repeat-containing protein [Lachnospiraceae bacterium]